MLPPMLCWGKEKIEIYYDNITCLTKSTECTQKKIHILGNWQHDHSEIMAL